MKFKSLTMRIWVVFTAVLIAVIAGITVLYHFAVRRVEQANRLEDLIVIHRAMMDNTTHDFQPFRELQNLRQVNHFQIKGGEIITVGRPQSFHNIPYVPQHNIQQYFIRYAKGMLDCKKVTTSLNGITFLAVVSSHDGGYFVSYMPHFQNDSILHALLFIGGIFIIAGFFIARIIAAYLAKPLLQLENFTKRIAAKKWDEPINIKSRDEIGRLASSMNKMQEDLKRAHEEERLFLQSISHDLKTPVMVIMSHADAIIDGVYIDTPENTAGIIKDEAISLSKKIKQLLYFNTLSYSLDNQSKDEKLSLDRLVLHTVNRLKPSRPDIFHEIQLEQTEIVASGEKLTVAIENVLDNAIRYAEDEINVTLKDRVLEIYNSGKNIPEENLERIFDNMYKDKTGNFGMGLAISKKIITHYSGTIHAENRPCGVSIIIEL